MKMNNLTFIVARCPLKDAKFINDSISKKSRPANIRIFLINIFHKTLDFFLLINYYKYKSILHRQDEKELYVDVGDL